MEGRDWGWIAAGFFFTFLGLAAIVWYSLGHSVPVLTGSTLSFAGIFAVVVGYVLTVGGFSASTRWEKNVVRDRDIYIKGVKETIAGEHPPGGPH